MVHWPGTMPDVASCRTRRHGPSDRATTTFSMKPAPTAPSIRMPNTPEPRGGVLAGDHGVGQSGAGKSLRGNDRSLRLEHAGHRGEVVRLDRERAYQPAAARHDDYAVYPVVKRHENNGFAAEGIQRGDIGNVGGAGHIPGRGQDDNPVRSQQPASHTARAEAERPDRESRYRCYRRRAELVGSEIDKRAFGAVRRAADDTNRGLAVER